MKPVSAAVARVLGSTTFLAFLVFTGVIPPAAARAQTITDGLVGLLNTQTLQPGDVVKDPEAAIITTQTVARALSIELATIPITSSAGGFVYRFNRSLASAAASVPGKRRVTSVSVARASASRPSAACVKPIFTSASGALRESGQSVVTLRNAVMASLYSRVT